MLQSIFSESPGRVGAQLLPGTIGCKPAGPLAASPRAEAWPVSGSGPSEGTALSQPPVQYERWRACRDAVGREAQVMVAIRSGEVTAVAPPGGTVRFGVDEVEELRRYIADLELGARVLEMEQRRLQRRAKRRGKRP